MAYSPGIRNRPRGRAAARLQVAQDCQRIPVHAQDIAAPVLASLVVQVKLRSFPVGSRLKSVDIAGRGDGCIVIESVDSFNRTTLKSQVAAALRDDNGLRNCHIGIVSNTSDTSSARLRLDHA